MCNNGIVCRTYQPKKRQRAKAWLPFRMSTKNGLKGSCPPPRPRPPKRPFQSRLIDLTISARQSAAPFEAARGVRSGPAKTGSGPFLSLPFWRQPRRALLICKEHSLKKNAQFKYVYRRGRPPGAGDGDALCARPGAQGRLFGGQKSSAARCSATASSAACAPPVCRCSPDEAGAVCVHRPPARRAARFDKSSSRSMQYLLRKQNLLLPDAQKKPRPAEKAADRP